MLASSVHRSLRLAARASRPAGRFLGTTSHAGRLPLQRIAIGTGSLFGVGTLLSLSAPRSETVAKCEAVATSKAVTSPEPASPNLVCVHQTKSSFLKCLGSLVCWSIIAAAWSITLALPFSLVLAVLGKKWSLAGGISAFFAFPKLVTLPTISGFRSLFLQGLLGWFPSTMLSHERPGNKEPEPEPLTHGEKGKPQMICVHPHGIYTSGFMYMTLDQPEARMLGSPFMSNLAPAFRLLLDLVGLKFGSVGPRELKARMSRQETPLAMVPGGFEEATVVSVGHERVFMKRRVGFVVYALRYGYDLVPCYTVGESDQFHNPQGAWKLRLGLNSLSIPAVLPFGFPLFPLLPRRVPLHTIIGEPVKMPHIPKPTKEDVEKHHKRYMDNLQRLVEEGCKGTPSEGRKLEFW